ncbi:MAG: AAA family ATPase [Armatimonadota bacterium]|nr:AAA family ATPase [Armatimonadota bacterium]MDR7444797.1 AAA family ATPase [Armatimonadota bacterium]MDR7569202.1 AAA family ATPase [Armatimonadota bacterium]MDR7613320.1 AAA family ATPase [Armatimonadota bacterium]
MPLTSDADVLRRRWILFDLDPARPGGVAATGFEHDAALHRAEEVREWLREQGWPEPVVVDSGNGAYLLYRVDLPNDAASTELVRAVLAAVDLHFTDGATLVDTKTFNAGRIVRLPGTTNRKGDPTPDRPHRMCRILHVPEPVQVVPEEALRAVAALAPAEPRVEDRRQNRGDPKERVERVIAALNLEVARSGPWGGGGWKWVFRNCPWEPELHRDRAAYIVVLPSGAITAGCHHLGCSSRGWKDLLALLPEGDRPRESVEPESTGPAKVKPVFRPVTELEAPPVQWVCEPLVPAGALTLLGGKDKRGKTLLALELARSVLSGEPFLGVFPVQTGAVVAVLLDDPLNITLDRLEEMGIRRHPHLFLLDLRDNPDPRDALGAMEEAVLSMKPALAIWDALFHLLPPRENALNDAALMGPVALRLDRIARSGECGLITILHDNKVGSDLAGSFVLRAAAKSILRLWLPRGAETEEDEPVGPRRVLGLETKLAAPQTWALELWGPGRWRFLGTLREAREADIRARILEFVRDHPGATTREILEGVQGATTRVLGVLERLCGEGVVQREGSGRRGDPFRHRVGGAGQDFVSESPFRGTKRETNRPEAASDLDLFVSAGFRNETEVRNEFLPDQGEGGVPPQGKDPGSGESSPGEGGPRGEDPRTPGGKEGLKEVKQEGTQAEGDPAPGGDQGGGGSIPDWAMGLAEALPRRPGTDPKRVAEAIANLLEPPIPRDTIPQEAQAPTCRTCGGRRWWRRPDHLGGGWVCARCHPPGPVQPVAWHGPEEPETPTAPRGRVRVEMFRVVYLCSTHGVLPHNGVFRGDGPPRCGACLRVAEVHEEPIPVEDEGR